MVTPRNYAKLCNATTLTQELIGAGILQNPTVGFKMYGVSVDPSPNTTVWVIDSLSPGDGTTVDNIVAAHVFTPILPALRKLFTFRADGYYRLFTIGTIDIDEAIDSYTLGHIVMRREIAGTGGQTVVDILKNGVSIYNVTPANRPTITAVMGNQARIVAALPDVLSITRGDRMEMSIVEVENGSPQDILLEIDLIIG